MVVSEDLVNVKIEEEAEDQGEDKVDKQNFSFLGDPDPKSSENKENTDLQQ